MLTKRRISSFVLFVFYQGCKSTDYQVDEEFQKLGRKETLISSSETDSGKVGDLLYISVSSESGFDSSASTPVNNGKLK